LIVNVVDCPGINPVDDAETVVLVGALVTVKPLAPDVLALKLASLL